MPAATDVVWVDVLPSMKGFGPAMSKGAGSAGATAGKTAGRSFGKAALAATAVVAGGAVLATKGLYEIGQTFQQVENTIRVGTGATGKALDGLTQSAKNIGKDVPANFEDIATAVADLNTRLGITGKPLEDMSGQFLNLSRITGTDISSNIANITRVFGDWSIAAEDQSGALDAIFRASQSTGIGIDELSQKVVQFGAPMRQLGFNFNESLAIFGKFEKEGVNVEAIMSGMRQGLGRMAKAGEDPIETFQRITDEIKNAGSTGEANAIALEAFGQRAGPDMAAAVREGRFELGDLVDTIANGSETINAASKDTMSFGESWQLFKNRGLVLIEPIATRVFDALGRGMEWLNNVGIPALTDFASVARDRLTPAFERVGSFIKGTVVPALKSLGSFVTGTVVPGFRDLAGWLKDNQEWLKPIAVGVLAAAAAYKVWTIATATWTAVTKGAALAQKALNAVMRANPIGIIILLLTGLAAGLAYAWKNSETFRKIVTKAWNVIQAAAKYAWERVIKPALSGFMTAMRALWNVVVTAKNFIVGAWNLIRAGLAAAWNWIRANVIARAISAFQAVWNKVVAVKDGVVGAWNRIRDGLGAAWRWINRNVISPVRNGFQSIVDKANDIRRGVVNTFHTMRRGIKSAWDAVLGVIKKPIRAVISFINEWVIGKINWVTKKFGFTIPKIGLPSSGSGGYSGGGPGQAGGGGRFNKGGLIPGGGPDRDSVRIDATPGEGVLTRKRMTALARSLGMSPKQTIAGINSGTINASTVAAAASGKPVDVIPDAKGGIFDDLSNAWDALKDTNLLPGWAKGAADVSSMGVKFLMGRAMDLAIGAFKNIPGPAIPMDVVSGVLPKMKEVMQEWGAKKDGQADKLGVGTLGDAGALGPLSPGGWASPLPRGQYRVGRGSAAHGYPSIDLPAAMGTAVRAVKSGVVSSVQRLFTSYGHNIRIGHGGGLSSLYAHLSSIGVRVGQRVRQGMRIGGVGSTGNSTGPHLHFEILAGGARREPKNYVKFDTGMGVLPPGHSLVYNGTGGDEPLIDPRLLFSGASRPQPVFTGDELDGVIAYKRDGDGPINNHFYGTPRGLANQVSMDIAMRRQARRPLMRG